MTAELHIHTSKTDKSGKKGPVEAQVPPPPTAEQQQQPSKMDQYKEAGYSLLYGAQDKMASSAKETMAEAKESVSKAQDLTTKGAEQVSESTANVYNLTAEVVKSYYNLAKHLTFKTFDFGKKVTFRVASNSYNLFVPQFVKKGTDPVLDFAERAFHQPLGTLREMQEWPREIEFYIEKKV